MLADEIVKDRAQPGVVRIGVVTSSAPLLIDVQGTEYRNVGVLGGYIPAVGQVVALLGQSAVSADGSSWLTLGQVVSSTDGIVSAIAVTSALDTATVSTVSAAYVPLGASTVGVAFHAPASGRVMVHWRAQLFADATTTGRMSFRVGEGSIVGAGTLVAAASDNWAVQQFSNVSSPEFGSSYLWTDLDAGEVYNVELQHRRSGGAGNTFYANRQIIVVPAP